MLEKLDQKFIFYDELTLYVSVTRQILTNAFISS